MELRQFFCSMLSPDTRSPIMVCISIYDIVYVFSIFKYDFKMGKEKTEDIFIHSNPFCSLMPTITDFNETFADSVLWFIFVFLFVGYIKLYYMSGIGKHYLVEKILGVILYLMLVLFECGAELSDGRIIGTVANLANDHLVNFRFILNFVCDLLIFFFLNAIDFKSKIVKGLAKGRFQVYIVH